LIFSPSRGRCISRAHSIAAQCAMPSHLIVKLDEVTTGKLQHTAQDLEIV